MREKTKLIFYEGQWSINNVYAYFVSWMLVFSFCLVSTGTQSGLRDSAHSLPATLNSTFSPLGLCLNAEHREQRPCDIGGWGGGGLLVCGSELGNPESPVLGQGRESQSLSGLADLEEIFWVPGAGWTVLDRRTGQAHPIF